MLDITRVRVQIPVLTTFTRVPKANLPRMHAFSYAWSLGHMTKMAVTPQPKTPMLHANLMALCFTEVKLLSTKVLHLHFTLREISTFLL